MNEPTMKEIAEWLHQAASHIDGLEKQLNIREPFTVYRRFVKRAAQVEAMGERRCKNCIYMSEQMLATPLYCTFDHYLCGIRLTHEDFGCIHWKRKEV